MRTVLTTLLAICVCLVIGCGQGPATVEVRNDPPEPPEVRNDPPEPAKVAVWPWPDELWREQAKQEKENQPSQKPLIGEARTKEKAEAGESDAQFWLGAMYEDSERGEKDNKEAVKWFQKAAEQGHAQAQASLGYMYATGKGVPQDYLTGYAWLHIAATKMAEDAKKHKGIIAKKMTAEDISKAQTLSREMLKKNPKLLN